MRKKRFAHQTFGFGFDFTSISCAGNRRTGITHRMLFPFFGFLSSHYLKQNLLNQKQFQRKAQTKRRWHRIMFLLLFSRVEEKNFVETETGENGKTNKNGVVFFLSLFMHPERKKSESRIAIFGRKILYAT